MAPLDRAGSFSCFLIGDDSLLVECGKLLLERGHRIDGVVSPIPQIRRWAAGVGLVAADVSEDLEALLGAAPFDYLFSVVNHRLLPSSILELPRKLPINFHDSLLPRGAGVFATTWAILAG